MHACVQTMQAKVVICAVPLTQLQKRMIAFEPPIEPEQQRLIDAITVRNAVKVWATFRERFWLSSTGLAAAASSAPLERFSGNDGDDHRDAAQDVCQRGPEFWDMLCPELEFPEIWAPQCGADAENGCAVAEVHGASARVHVLTAFVSASKADALSRAGPQAAVQKLLAQLDLVFSQQQPRGNDSVGPATAAFVGGGMVDWSKERFIEGGYSSPSMGVPAGARAGLQAAAGGMLFFAGEHTHEKLNSCLQGAMQTGRRAAQSVLAAIGS